MAITMAVHRVSEQRPPGDAGDWTCKTRCLSLGHSSLHMLEKPWEIDIKFPEFICSHCGTLALKYEVKSSMEVLGIPVCQTLYSTCCLPICLLRRSGGREGKGWNIREREKADQGKRCAKSSVYRLHCKQNIPSIAPMWAWGPVIKHTRFFEWTTLRLKCF